MACVFLFSGGAGIQERKRLFVCVSIYLPKVFNGLFLITIISE